MREFEVMRVYGTLIDRWNIHFANREWVEAASYDAVAARVAELEAALRGACDEIDMDYANECANAGYAPTAVASEEWRRVLECSGPVCRHCHGEGLQEHGDPEVGSAKFKCDACDGTGRASLPTEAVK